VRAVLATHGSTGDVEPFLALAQRLGSRGHNVVVAGPPVFARRAAHLGVPFEAMDPAREDDLPQVRFQLGGNLPNPLDMARVTLGHRAGCIPQPLERPLGRATAAGPMRRIAVGA
jgi:UDP:flavonoid glycosyltransferase YjiC (YdhE family)